MFCCWWWLCWCYLFVCFGFGGGGGRGGSNDVVVDVVFGMAIEINDITMLAEHVA